MTLVERKITARKRLDVVIGFAPLTVTDEDLAINFLHDKSIRVEPVIKILNTCKGL